MKIISKPFDFSAIAPAMQSYVDRKILSGVSSAVLHGQDLVHFHATGWADIENQIPLNQQHLFRIFSNSKLVTSIAILQLIEEGLLDLDDPIESYLPQLGKRQVYYRVQRVLIKLNLHVHPSPYVNYSRILQV